MNISQDIKDWIINEYINEKHKTYRRIMKDVYEKFDLEIQIEDYVEVLEEYRKIMPGDLPVLFKMKDLWTYMSQCFTNSEQYLKKIRKANRIPEYEIAVNALFREQEIID